MIDKILTDQLRRQILEKVDELPVLTRVTCAQVSLYICEEPAQLPLQTLDARSFFLVIPLTHSLILPDPEASLLCGNWMLLALGPAHLHACLLAKDTAAGKVKKRIIILQYHRLMLASTEQETGLTPEVILSAKLHQPLNTTGLTRLYDILSTCCGQQPASPSSISYSAYMLLLHVSHLAGSAACRGQQEKAAGSAFQKILETYQYMQNHFTCKLTIHHMAERVGCSDSQYIRLFRKHFHTSPYQMVIMLRLHKAMHCLLYSNNPVGMIAGQCGFSSHSQFSHLFLRMTGLSPQQYRKCLDRFSLPGHIAPE